MKTSTPAGTSAETSVPETLKLIYSRRAVRKYTRQPVEKQLIEMIIDAGRMAPSAINKQPWKFYVLRHKDDIKMFSKAIAQAAAKDVVQTGIKGMVKVVKELLHFSHGIDVFKITDPVFHGAPVVIFITSPRDNEWAALDVGMCSQNIMLAAKALGLDSCPVGFGKYVEHTDVYPQLGIPATEEVNLAIVIGYGDEQPEIHERNRNNLIYI